jgi:hypothetical protein
VVPADANLRGRIDLTLGACVAGDHPHLECAAGLPGASI